MLASFRSRLVISNLLITLVGLLIIVFVFISVLASRSQSIRSRDLRTESRLVANQIDYLFQHHLKPGTGIQQYVYSTSRALQVRVVLVSPRGQISVDSKNRTPFYRGSWNLLDRAALRNLQTASRQLKSSSVRSFQSPLEGTAGRVAGAVILVASVSDVSPGLAELHDVLLIVLGIALCVWLAIGLYFTVSISRPLLRMTAATQRMARGQYDTRVPVKGNGEIARLAGSFNVMAQQVQQTNRVLKDFVANVSHDLRTPLTMISGFSEALLDGTAGAEDSIESARVIHDEAIKMQHLVEELLQLTRLESGLMTFRPQPVEVYPFVQSIVDRIAHAHAGRPIATLENRVSPRFPRVDIDREQMERALRNLLENALRFTPPDGRIRVEAQAIGRGWVELSVSDTGTGIARQDVPRIFERFYRADKSRERAHCHSGLGLAIVREIVEGHGGRIEVESEVGKGTVFRFTVPQAGEPAAEREITPARDPARQPMGQ